MEQVGFQNDVPAALRLNDTLDKNRSRPHGLTKRDWDDLKPKIRELYLDQRQTLQQVAKYLEEQYGWKPTKKQLLYRISGWRFEKNVKKDERRAIIDSLAPGKGNVEIEPQTLKGRILDAAKLNRWMQLEKTTSGESSANNKVVCARTSLVPYERNFIPTNQDSDNRTSTQIPNYKEQYNYDLEIQDKQSVPVLRYDGLSFDWNSVEVIGSPGLTKLLGALTIEECDIPLLDLASDALGSDSISGSDLIDLCCTREESTVHRRQPWSTRLSASMKTSQAFEGVGRASKLDLQFEVYPFPISLGQSCASKLRFFSGVSVNSTIPESECQMKLQKMKHMQDTEIIHLVEAMGARAEELYDQDIVTAETWFRRVVRAKKLVSWYKPHQTLWACLQVARCLYFQNRFKEAQRLQQGVHGTIEQIFGTSHEVTIQSTDLHADLLGHLGFSVEEEAIRRQILQIRLNAFGMRHQDTLWALEDLGACLGQRERSCEAQQLLETSIRLRLEPANGRVVSAGAQYDILWDLTNLAHVMTEAGRYDESENVLDFAHNSLADATRSCHESSFEYHHQRACNYWLQDRFEESEIIFRGLLGYHRDHMMPSLTLNSMQKLADILEETGRHLEAVYWLKKVCILNMKICGLTHRYTMNCCRKVGLIYRGQNRYNSGKLFFENLGLRTSCIQRVYAWMRELEEQRLKNSTKLGSNTSESMDSEREPIDMDDNFDYEDMGDIPDPLDY
ncbi:hypothetical protein N431DRAFT_551067 [Stipitochalara longipes BDJ]|nr:hypothetical protein N431DRAFT_551067 [Stipitochalara longipes BDJ]